MLWRNRDLLMKSGYFMPMSGVRGVQHAALSDQLIGMRQKRRFLLLAKPGNWQSLCGDEAIVAYQDLLEEVNVNNGVAVLSSEGFQNADPNLMAMLYAPEKTKIVIYLREQLSYMLSAYAQSVHGFRKTTESLKEYAEIFDCDYYAQICKWVKVYGKDRVILRLYERERFPEGDVRKDFLKILGIDDYQGYLFEKNDPNPSIGGTLLEFKRVLNGVVDLSGAELVKKLAPITKELALKHKSFREAIRVGEEISELIRDRYRDSNGKLFREYIRGQKGFVEKSFVDNGLPPGFFDCEELPVIWSAIEAREPEFCEQYYEKVMRYFDC